MLCMFKNIYETNAHSVAIVSDINANTYDSLHVLVKFMVQRHGWTMVCVLCLCTL